MQKFRNKYRIPSTRLQKWDYGWNAPYFVTICTAHRVCYFGDIRDREMILSDIGEIVVDQWLKTPVVRPDMNLILDEFVVMPNHFHGIIIIGQNDYNHHELQYRDDCRDAMHGVSTVKTVKTINNDVIANTNVNPNPNPNNRFGPQIKNLPSIIRGFKSAVTINARKINIDFAWQPRFHEHIIRDQKSYKRIRNYIIENPGNWRDDDFYK